MSTAISVIAKIMRFSLILSIASHRWFMPVDAFISGDSIIALKCPFEQRLTVNLVSQGSLLHNGMSSRNLGRACF
jgi:hypothetical protein